VSVRVLLVEDSPTDALLISSLLGGDPDSFTVTHVGTLADGLAQLEATDFDLVILDLILPDSEGLATFETLSNLHPGTAVVVATGMSDDTLGLAAVARGASATKRLWRCRA
jgi:CheY-like chemotaxis protein